MTFYITLPLWLSDQHVCTVGVWVAMVKRYVSTNQCCHFCPRQSFYVNSPITVVHTYALFISSMQDVPHQTSASGAEYAVSSKAVAHQYDDVKDKKLQGLRLYATICIDPLSSTQPKLGIFY